MAHSAGHPPKLNLSAKPLWVPQVPQRGAEVPWMLAAATILNPFLEGGRAFNPRYIHSKQLEGNKPHPLSCFKFFGPLPPQVEKRVTMLGSYD